MCSLCQPVLLGLPLIDRQWRCALNQVVLQTVNMNKRSSSNPATDVFSEVQQATKRQQVQELQHIDRYEEK